jgi:hypothetical protein
VTMARACLCLLDDDKKIMYERDRFLCFTIGCKGSLQLIYGIAARDEEEDHGNRRRQRYYDSPRIRTRQRAKDVLRDGGNRRDLCDSLNDNYSRSALHFERAEAFIRLAKKAEALEDAQRVPDDIRWWTFELRTKEDLIRDCAVLGYCQNESRIPR